MKRNVTFGLLVPCALAFAAIGGSGCANTQTTDATPGYGQANPRPSANAPASGSKSAPARSAPARPMKFTPGDNPTARDGRGAPSLDEFDRPAAWIYVDGKAGRFVEVDGRPAKYWLIEEPVSSMPSFRVEVYSPVLGDPRDMNGVLAGVDEPHRGNMLYAFSAAEGSFRIGKDYSLLQPGDGFTVRNNMTGDVVQSIPELEPGAYSILVGIKNKATGAEGLAVTQFTVGG